ncbi:MAG: hypothetical protein ACOC2X_03765, partial [Bacillota bacterium]
KNIGVTKIITNTLHQTLVFFCSEFHPYDFIPGLQGEGFFRMQVPFKDLELTFPDIAERVGLNYEGIMKPRLEKELFEDLF